MSVTSDVFQHPIGTPSGQVPSIHSETFVRKSFPLSVINVEEVHRVQSSSTSTILGIREIDGLLLGMLLLLGIREIDGDSLGAMHC